MSLTIVLVCAHPLGATEDDGGLADAVEAMFVDGREVVASSPVPSGVSVGSHYGWRTSTRTGNRTFHAGVDFLTPRGTPVYAVRPGIVETVVREEDRTRRWAGYGNAVVVRHEDEGRWSFYAHLDRVEVEVGQIVMPGQKLGSVGNTTQGRFPNMVPHLHFEVRRARADGSSPFPAGYRRYNLDPEAWLADMGVDLDRHDAGGHDCPEHDRMPALVVRDRVDAADAVAPDAVASSDVGTARF